VKRLIVAAALVALPGVAAAQSMNAERFWQRATALKAKGPLALLEQREIGALITEAKAAGKRADAQRLAAIKARKKPRYCPPDADRSMNSDEFLQRLSAIPARDRKRINMIEATARIAAQKFPCRR
jgi:hypothetical protein